MKVKLIADSTCNCPEAYRQLLDIDIVPVYVIFGKESYKDYEEMSIDAFHRRLAASNKMPTSSQPTPNDFAQAYAKARDEGYSDAIVVTVTAKASGTFSAAKSATDMVKGIDVHVVDSGAASLMMGWMLEEAKQVLDGGGSVEDALAAMERIKANSAIIFAVTDIRHLAYSGRTKGSERATQAAVKLRPIVSIQDGIPQALGQERTNKAALGKVLALISSKKGTHTWKRLAIVHAGIPDDAAAWAEEAKAALGYDDSVEVVDFGPGLTVHFGPGMLGVTGCWQ